MRIRDFIKRNLMNFDYLLYIIRIIILYLIFFLSININVSSSSFTSQSHPQNREEIEKLIEKVAPNEDAFLGVQTIAAHYVKIKDWLGASAIYQKYKDKFPWMEERFDKIILMLESEDEKIEIKNLGDSINAKYSNYAPVPSADGKTLYFCSPDRPDGFGGEDVWVSKYSDNNWHIPTNLGPQINSELNEAIVSISTDGNTLILFINGDLYYVERNKTGWSDLQPFPSPINSKFWDGDGSFTSDGKAFIFASDRPGTNIGDYHPAGVPFHGDKLGNIDIYVTVKTDSGWGRPINLGIRINTPFCDRSPFLHPDGKTLYFCSDGHYGLGHLDVFKATKLEEDSWTDWSEPVNIGKEINTTENDIGYHITTKGEIAYFSTLNFEKGLNLYNLYSITLPYIARPEPVAMIRGIIRDENDNNLDADIIWTDLETGKDLGRLKSNPQDGSFFIALPLGKNYDIHAEKDGYFPVSKNMNLKFLDSAIEDDINIVLFSKEKILNKFIKLNIVFFDFNKDMLKGESNVELTRLLKLVRELSEYNIEIVGHTDSIGTDEYNLDLSYRRAQAVVDYLVSKGIDKHRLIAKGYGERQPIAPNDTEEGRALNRRVEFIIHK
jgi:outer membrane protein OmpA-like peptidoglycan-associated protein